MPGKVENIFSPKSSRVLRAVLVEYGRDWNEREIAEAVDVSSGMAHYVTKKLIELGFMSRNESNRLVLTDPVRLLRRWAAYHQYDRANKFLEYYTFEREIEAFLSKLHGVDAEYCLTSLAAAWLVAPYVRPVDIHLYVKRETVAKTLSEKLGLHPTPRMGNVKLVVPYDEGIFHKATEAGGVRVVSDIQLYVDLYNFPARGEEAASKVLDAILQRWHLKR